MITRKNGTAAVISTGLFNSMYPANTYFKAVKNYKGDMVVNFQIGGTDAYKMRYDAFGVELNEGLKPGNRGDGWRYCTEY